MTLDQILDAVKAKTIDLAEAEKLIASLKKTASSKTVETSAHLGSAHTSSMLNQQSDEHLRPTQALAPNTPASTTEMSAILPSVGLKSVHLDDVTQQLRKTLAVTLFMDESEVREDASFIDMGLDSIVGVEWMRELNRLFGLEMPVTDLYDHATLPQLAGHIVASLPNDASAASVAPLVASVAEPARASQTHSTPQAPLPEAPALSSTPKATDEGNALVVSTVQTLDEVRLSAWQITPPKATEVTVEVKASAINFPDAMCVNGLYPTMPAYPFVPGFEVAGVISAVGSQVSEFRVGDAVIAITGEHMGGHASQVNVPADNTVLKPSNITFEEACSLPVAFGIVYHAFDIAQLTPNETVLVQTATGGCGLLAIQLARLAGCDVFGTSSREAKLEVLRRLNVQHRINYQTEAFDQRIAQITQKRGVDVVLNMLSGEHIQTGLNCLAPEGRYLEIAVHALKTSPKLDLSRLVSNQSIHSIDLRRLSLATGEGAKPHLEAMVALLKDELIVPVLSRVYPFKRIGEAIQYVGQGQHIGKVVVSHTCDQVIDYTDMCIGRMLEQQHLATKRAPSLYPAGFSSLVIKPKAQALQDNAVLNSPAQVEAVPHFANGLSKKEPIAVLGIAGQFPQSANIQAFWQNIEQGVDCVTEVTPDRWDNQQYYDPDPQALGKTHCKWMGMLPDADKFDAAFFNISPNEAVAMDPQQRMILQAAWSCIEDAGINADDLSGALCGIYIGVAPGDYGMTASDEELSSQGLMGRSLSILSARTAFFMNLKGPCITLDTACSSSLVAIAEACNHLQLGTCDIALAGGVNVLATPYLHIMTSKAEMLSADGRCFTFDNRANGFVPCEGVGMLLLKTLSAAQRDGDAIKGVIRGWGVNQDGKTNGITAPSTVSQTELEQRVYDRFDIDPRSIGLIETHGTGTKLGDPIEIRALKQAFAKYTKDTAFCALGSVKSSIGHGLASAGVAGSIKVLMALQNKTLPPLANFTQLNEHIELDNSPFYIPQTAQKWQPAVAGQPRRAAVSSFGFSGTNAHIVFEEAPLQQAVNDLLPVYPFILSARTVEQLQAHASQLQTYVKQHNTLDAGSIAYTLLVGRKVFKHRLVILAANVAQLQDKLQLAVLALSPLATKEASPDSPQLADGVFYGAVKGRVTGKEQGQAELQMRGEQILTALATSTGPITQTSEFERDLTTLAQLFVTGYALQYRQMLGFRSFSKVSLPTYPFAKTRYWLAQNPPVAVASAKPAVLTAHSTEAPADAAFAPTSVQHRADTPIVVATKPNAIQLIAPEQIATPQAKIVEKHRLILPESACASVKFGNLPPAHNAAMVVSTAVAKAQSVPSAPPLASPSESPIYLELTDLGRGVFGIEIHQAVPVALIPALVLQLQAGLQQVSEPQTSRVVVLKGLANLPQSGVENAALLALINTVKACALPLIVQISGAKTQTSLAALMLASIADLSVWQTQDYDWSAHRLFLEADAGFSALLTERFDAHFTQFGEASALTFSADAPSGRLCVSEHAIEHTCLALAYRLADAPKESLTLLKQHFLAPLESALHGRAFAPRNASPLASMGKAVAQQQWCDLVAKHTGQTLDLSLHAGVFSHDVLMQAEHALGDVIHQHEFANIVTLSHYQQGVVEITLHDKQQHNMLSHAMMEALADAFDSIANLHGAKVVVLTGYDQYFSLGGTKAGLQSIHSGEVKFTDSTIYSIAMQCALPVIAAIQGHGIGAGWALGMYSDFVILGKESIYISPYMGYGFTPGAGATLVFTRKYGKDLGREILFSAREYAGRELAQRSTQIAVAPRQNVLAIARKLACALAGLSRDTLMQFKAQFNQSLGDNIQQVYQLEQAMHEITFVGNHAVLQGIENRFVDNLTSQDADQAGEEAMISSKGNDSSPDSASPAVDKQTLRGVLVSTLAEQLGMEDDEIEEDQEFVELGLDSVVGVTWIRKINELYQLDVAVTKVYQYPTIDQLAEHILTLLPTATKAQASDAKAQAKSDIAVQPQTDVPLADVSLKPVQPEKSVKLTLNLPAISAQDASVSPVCDTPVSGSETPVSATSRLQPAKAQPDASKVGVQQSAEHTLAPALTKPKIAIIGMAGQFPKANDVDAYWDNICQQRDCIEEVPAARWDINALYDPKPMQANKSYSKWMGRIEHADHFDPLFFSISPQEALAMDPQQRLILQTSWHCLENAGYDPERLSGSLTGVYIGCGPNDYGYVQSSEMNAEGLTGSSASILTGRISYQLNLQGPCVAIDTACSSSLVAIATACDALTLKNCDMALAGGVCVMAGPSIHVMTSNAGMLSPEGRCFTFDQRADGFVPAEGVGLVCLKRLDDAERDGDRIEATLVGWGTNQDGKTNGITAPNPESQTRLQRQIYQHFNIDPAQIQLVETHGTGTKLGDPIEIEALTETFKSVALSAHSSAEQNTHVTAIGSVKSNIGHAQAAAGIASVIKVAKALHHKILPPTAHFTQLNEHISLKGTPFYVNTEQKAWTVAKGHKRHGTVSSFGFSGTNAHLVLAEYLPTHAALQNPKTETPTATQPALVVLSARTESQLLEQVANLHAFLTNQQVACSLNALAYTLQTGRKAMSFRLALVADSLSGLIAQLEKCLAQARPKKALASGKNSFMGEAGKDKAMLDLFANNSELQQSMQTWLQQGNFVPLAELWVKGVNLDWQRLYTGQKPQPLALPLYPFAKESYWISANPSAQENRVDLSDNAALASSIVSQVATDNTIEKAHQAQPAFLYVNESWQDQALDSIADQRGIVERVSASLEANEFKPVQIWVLFQQVREGETFIQTLNAQLDAISPALRDYVVINREQISAMDEVFYQGLRAQPVDVVFFLGAGKPGLNGAHTLAEKALKPIFELSRHLVAHQHHHACELYYCCSQVLFDAEDNDAPQSQYYGLYQQGLSGLFRAIASEVETHHFCTLTHSQAAYQQGRAYADIAKEWLTHWLGAKGTAATKKRHTAAAQLAMVRYLDQVDGRINPQTTADTTAQATPPSQRQIAVLSEWLPDADAGETGENSAASASARQPHFRQGATYLVAGGLGEVGFAVCLKLAAQYRPTLVMLSRTEQNQKISEQLAQLTQAGARVIYHAVDINDDEALAQVYTNIKTTVGDIHGVWHLARHVSDARIEHKSTSDFFNTIAAKTTGTLNLDAITKDEPLDFFLLFSSMAAFGIEGSCDYGYATAFQNQFADYRNQLVSSQQRRGISSAICWGQWSLDHYSNEQRDLLLWQMGFDFITPEQAIALSQTLMQHAQHHAVLGVMAVNDSAKVRHFYQLPAKQNKVHKTGVSLPKNVVTLPRGALQKTLNHADTNAKWLQPNPGKAEHTPLLAQVLQLISEQPSQATLAQLEAQLFNASPDELAALYQKLVNEE